MARTVFSIQGAQDLEFSVNPVYPERLEADCGLTVGLTEGGALYAYGKGRPYLLHTLRFEDMPSSDFDGGFDYVTGTQGSGTQSLINWFMYVAPPGGGPFSYGDPFGGTHYVELADPRLEFSLTAKGLYSGTLRLKEYVGSL
jgi:hypothetical protein